MSRVNAKTGGRYREAVGFAIATALAPLLLMSPFLLFELSISSRSEPFRLGFLGIPLLASAIAGALFAVADHPARSHRRAIGGRWIVAFSLSAATFAPTPHGSSLDLTRADLAVLGAAAGAITAVLFSGLLRLVRRAAV